MRRSDDKSLVEQLKEMSSRLNYRSVVGIVRGGLTGLWGSVGGGPSLWPLKCGIAESQSQAGSVCRLSRRKSDVLLLLSTTSRRIRVVDEG